MSHQQRFIEWLSRHGETATYNVISGDACPCMSSRGGGGSSYSEEWHRNNSEDDDCGGTGLINSSTSATNIKAIFSTPGVVANTIPIKEMLEVIGEIQNTDLFMWGTLDTDNDAYISISGNTEYVAYITKSSVDYSIRHVSTLPDTTGQVAHLVRRT